MKKIVYFLCISLIMTSFFSSYAADSFSNKKSEFNNNISSYLKSRQEYLSSYNQYRSECIKDEKSCEKFKEDVLNDIKNYFKYSIASSISYFDLLKIKVENSYGSEEQKKELTQKMDSLISLFEEKEKIISVLDDSKKIKDLSNELKTAWANSESQSILVNASVYSWKVQFHNKQLNDFALEIENYIVGLGKKYNVNDLLIEYNDTKVSLLALNKNAEQIEKEAQSITKDKYQSFKQKITDYKKSKLQIIENYKKIITKLKENNFKELSKAESGKLQIKGEGKVTLVGEFEVSGNLSDAGVTGDISASLDDNVDIFDNGKSIKDNDNVLYSGVKEFSIKSIKTVIINSGYLDITIVGRGKISIEGYGLYKSDSVGSWLEISKDNFEISI